MKPTQPSSMPLPPGPRTRTGPAKPPTRTTLKGQYVTLVPLEASHAASLYPLCSGRANSWIWTYIPANPFVTTSPAGIVSEVPDPKVSYSAEVKKHSESTTTQIFFAVIPNADLPPGFLNVSPGSTTTTATAGDALDGLLPAGQPLSYLSFLSPKPAHRTIEIGHVVFTAPLARTTLATEAIYLLMKHAFEDLGYSRVEWKCDVLNERSKRAAERLGFVHEGVFRRHMIVWGGRRRDTWWGSLVEEEWWGRTREAESGGTGQAEDDEDDEEGKETSRKWALEQWLRRENFGKGAKQLKKLEDFQAWKKRGKGN